MKPNQKRHIPRLQSKQAKSMKEAEAIKASVLKRNAALSVAICCVTSNLHDLYAVEWFE